MLINITITAEFGSKFRRECALDSLISMLSAWASFEENANKKTKIRYFVSKDGEFYHFSTKKLY